MIPTLIDLLKYLAALAVIGWIGYYVWTHGLPPRGRGRWRKFLRDQNERKAFK